MENVIFFPNYFFPLLLKMFQLHVKNDFRGCRLADAVEASLKHSNVEGTRYYFLFLGNTAENT